MMILNKDFLFIMQMVAVILAGIFETTIIWIGMRNLRVPPVLTTTASRGQFCADLIFYFVVVLL
jgi:hypothetical protein